MRRHVAPLLASLALDFSRAILYGGALAIEVKSANPVHARVEGPEKAYGSFVSRRTSKTALAALLIVAVGTAAGDTRGASADSSAVGPAASHPVKSATSNWGVYVWDSSFSSLHEYAPDTPSGAVAGFPLQTRMTALLTTTNNSGLLGNLTGKTLSASVSLSVTGTVVYGLEGTSQNNCTGTPANVRFFFSTDSTTYSPTTAGQNETGYWWSNPANVPMNASVSGASLSVPLTAGNWSDANGHSSSDPNYTAGFNAAVSNVRQLGVSFGGGCYSDTGIGVANGKGSFTLNSITVG